MATLNRFDFFPPDISAGNMDVSKANKVLPITLPGSPYSPWVRSWGWAATGNDFILQFKAAGGPGASYEGEICGMRSYIKEDWGATHDGQSYSGGTEITYEFIDGENPEIRRVSATVIADGSGKPPFAGRGTEPNHKDYVVIRTNSSGDESVDVVGALNLTNEVSREFLKSEAERYLRAPRAWRERVGGSTNFVSSDSPGGWYAKFGVGTVRAEADISQDVVWSGVYEGFQGTAIVNFRMRDRQNAPCLYDEGDWLASGIGLYGVGSEEWVLENLITQRVWRDEHGTYDPGQDAIDDIGWVPGLDWNWITSLRWGDGSTCGKACFFSVDAHVYRITSEAWRNVNSEFHSVQIVTVETPSGGGLVEFEFTRSVIVAGDANGWWIIRVERKTADGWTVLAADGYEALNYVGNNPYQGYPVVVGHKFRTGQRWGHTAFTGADSGSARWRTKRLKIDRQCASEAS